MTEQFNSADFKQRQKQEWDAMAPGWSEAFDQIERGASVVSAALIEMAGIGSGHRVLDVATGIGEPAVSVARVVGSTGSVVATDQSTVMLELARKRADSLGLSNIDFVEGDSESLDFPENSFDRVVCRWGLMFLPDLESCVDRLHNFLAPSGNLATAVWGNPPEVPMMFTAMSAVGRELNLPPPPPDAPSPFGMADTSRLESALGDAGFTGIKVRDVNVVMEFGTTQEYLDMVLTVGGPMRDTLETLPQSDRDRVTNAVEDAASQFAADDGIIRMTNRAICIAASKG